MTGRWVPSDHRVPRPRSCGKLRVKRSPFVRGLENLPTKRIFLPSLLDRFFTAETGRPAEVGESLRPLLPHAWPGPDGFAAASRPGKYALATDGAALKCWAVSSPVPLPCQSQSKPFFSATPPRPSPSLRPGRQDAVCPEEVAHERHRQSRFSLVCFPGLRQAYGPAGRTRCAPRR